MQKKGPLIKSVAEYRIYLDVKLGEGSFGCVYEGLDTKDNEKIAVKMLEKKATKGGNEQDRLNQIKKQTQILHKLNSEHIVAFKDMLTTNNYYYIIQEKCDEDLRKYIKRHPDGIPEKQVIEFTIQLLKAFYAMIVTNVIHRDLKPENILIKDGKLKVADFGLSKRIGVNQIAVSTVGTEKYCSPQVARREKYTSSCDVWSLGFVMYEMLYGKPPLFSRGSHQKVIQDLREMEKEGREFEFPVRPVVSEEMQRIIARCIRCEEKDRATWRELFGCPLFKGHLPSLEKLDSTLTEIMSKIRHQVIEKNVDLGKFFHACHLKADSQINFAQFMKIIFRLVSIYAINADDVKYCFNYFDKDKDGTITFQQFYESLKNYGITATNTNTSQEIVNSTIPLDTNEKVILAFKKFVTELERSEIVDIENRFAQLQILTEDGVKLDEFTNFLQNQLGLKMTDGECETIFRTFDEDGSNTLDVNEFEKNICHIMRLPIRNTKQENQRIEQAVKQLN